MILIYQNRTDSGITIETVTKEKLADRVKELQLTRWDYAICEGKVLKTFESQWTPKK